MANWAYKVDFRDFYHKYPDELSIQGLAKLVVGELENLLDEIRKEPESDISIHAAYREEFLSLSDDLENGIIPQFEEISEDEEADENSFDYAMSDLYDWADAPLDNKFGGVKMCWVNTF